MISIKGLNKGAVLAALYNNARIQGLGVRNPAGSVSMTAEEGTRRIAGPGIGLGRQPGEFDYLNGRVLKVDLRGDEFDEQLYDRDNGQGKAARVIDNLRRTGSVEEII